MQIKYDIYHICIHLKTYIRIGVEIWFGNG